MPKGKEQKLKLYRLSRIMLEKTDETHMLDINGVKAELEKYGITADRKSLYDDFDALSVLGIIVEGFKDGRHYYYHVVEKPFELAELKLLVDAIQCSKFITEKKSRNLIKKLMSNVSEYEALQLNRQVAVSGRIKTMNESIFYNVDEIHHAISENKTITFDYLKWNKEKELVPRRSIPYEESPWALTWDDENYYLIAYDKEEKKIKHFRVDKMRNIRMTEKKRDGKDIFNEFNMASYAKANFGMYGGEEKSVHLKFKEELVGVFLDRFGTEIPIHESNRSGYFETHVNVAISEQFFGWLFGLGTGVEIIGPKDVREEYRLHLKEIFNIY